MNAAGAEAVELVVFDLGQVLVRVCNGWRDACERAGIPITPEYAATHDDPGIESRMQEIVAAWDCGRLDLRQFAERVAPLRGLTRAQVERIHHSYLLGPFDGAAELLDELNALGLQTACLSNTNAGHWEQMHDRHGPNYLPLDRLTHRFTSHLIGACKPDAKIYGHVEATTSRSGGQILFFDDREENVRAARERGWHGELIELDGNPIAQVRAHLLRHGVRVAV